MAYSLCEKARSLTPYDPVEGVYRVRMDANESFLLPTDEDRRRMAQAAADVALNRYPDPAAGELCTAFAQLYGVKPELVTAGQRLGRADFAGPVHLPAEGGKGAHRRAGFFDVPVLCRDHRKCLPAV